LAFEPRYTLDFTIAKSLIDSDRHSRGRVYEPLRIEI